MNTRCVREYAMLVATQLLRSWCEQRPSNQVGSVSSIMGEDGRVYYTELNPLLISFIYRSTRLFLGCW
jgi:hypothetical protein